MNSNDIISKKIGGDKMKNKMKVLHIAIIILGTIFIALSAFHANVWFDEAYSVAIANHSYSEIWTIGGHDVHPILYYWILHTLFFIFGNNILVFRIFSVLVMTILGIIGYTHIRKDFGEKIGILFSFLVLFFPVNLVYSGEIRMYSLAMLLVTLMAIYAYRIYRNKEEKKIKNWVFFAIFSLASAYTHYYALMAAGIINLMLFIYLVLQTRKTKKISFDMKAFIASAIFQIVCYLPWLLYLLLQMKHVSDGFWIGITFPDTLIEFFTFQFTGNLGGNLYISNLWAGIFGIFICGYMIYLYVHPKKEGRESKKEEDKKQMHPAKLAILIYGLIILAAYLISLLWHPIFYPRYMLCISGLFLFFIAFSMAKLGNKYINTAIIGIILILSLIINVNLIKMNYSKTNQEPLEYLKENLQESDLLVYENNGNGYVVAANYPEQKQYLWNKEKWNIQEAYQAFGKDITIIDELDELKDYMGRILVVNTNDYAIADRIEQKYEVKIVDKQSFKTEYKDLSYTFTILEKY